MSYKIGIVGAARRHQGTGPYIAQIFNQLGHNVAGIVGSSRESAEKTSADLKQQYDITAQAYTRLETLLSKHDIDALVISSPPATHLGYLEEALSKKIHVFCEKPLWWPDNSDKTQELQAYLTKIQNCLNYAAENQCLLHLNTQWPYTLTDFYRLYPDILPSEITHFSMNLCPQSDGVSMLVDAASHGLSMLYALVGQGELSNIVFTHSSSHHLSASFDYRHQAGQIKVTLGFTRSQAVPKPASYTINHCKVDRIVSLPDYQIKLQSSERCEAIKDPLMASIQDFIASVQAGLQTDTMMLMSGARHLHQLIESYE